VILLLLVPFVLLLVLQHQKRQATEAYVQGIRCATEIMEYFELHERLKYCGLAEVWPGRIPGIAPEVVDSYSRHVVSLAVCHWGVLHIDEEFGYLVHIHQAMLQGTVGHLWEYQLGAEYCRRRLASLAAELPALFETKKAEEEKSSPPRKTKARSQKSST
jgi:hypothetical protein